MELLLDGGAVVSYNDPHIPALAADCAITGRPEHDQVPLTPEFLAPQDCVLIATDHTAYDYELSSAMPGWWSTPATPRGT